MRINFDLCMAQFYLQWYVTDIELGWTILLISTFFFFQETQWSWQWAALSSSKRQTLSRDAQPTKPTCIGNFNFLMSTLEFQLVFFTTGMAMSISFILNANFNRRCSTQQKKKTQPEQQANLTLLSFSLDFCGCSSPCQRCVGSP